MPVKLETSRLILKSFHIEDAALLLELNSDPDVVKYTGDIAYRDLNEVHEFIKGYNQYEKYGLGRLNMFTKHTGEYIGWCGLEYLKSKNETDIGYRLLKKHWGKGYATEVAIVCLDYGFNTLNLKQIIGTAMKANPASINVFNKCGLKYWYDDECGNEPGVVYIIKKEEWK
jgi:ribosomal-protein-alanine N-acetyltransferase